MRGLTMKSPALPGFLHLSEWTVDAPGSGGR